MYASQQYRILEPVLWSEPVNVSLLNQSMSLD